MAFVPLSPAHSEMAVFQPLSPAHSQYAYEPQSPREEDLKKPGKSASLIEKLLYNIKNPTTFQFKPKPYSQISDWQSYCRHLIFNEKEQYNYSVAQYDSKLDTLAKNLNSVVQTRRNLCLYRRVFNTWLNQSKTVQFTTDPEFILHSHQIIERLKKDLKFRLKQLKEAQERATYVRFMEISIRERKKCLGEVLNAWRDTCPTPRKPVNEPINVSRDPYHIVTKFTVREDGTVGVKISAPLGHIYDKYYKKLLVPPHKEHMEALREFGYPEWVIERAEKHYAKRADLEAPSCTLQESLEKQSKIKKSKTKVKSTLDKFKSLRSWELLHG